ncbi:MAG: endonuclease/exonuclease/phosphatase family protein [Planctomycetota bacterium]
MPAKFPVQFTIFVCLLIGPGFATAVAQTGTFLDKLNATDVRVVSYNLGGFNDNFSDQPFDFVGGQWRFDDHYARVVGALEADVWAFQEIQSRSAADVRNALNLADPLPDGASWFTHKTDEQVIASRHPFLDTGALLAGSPRSPAVATIDLPLSMSADDLHVVNLHLKAGGSASDESQRIRDVDRIIRYFKDAQTPGGPEDLDPGIPFVVLGDFNTASGTAPVDNLRFGDITTEALFGPDELLDWDETALSIVDATHNNGGFPDWTWRGSRTSRLDWQVYSDSVASLSQAFVLNTQLLTAAERQATGLQPNDVLYSSSFWDHVPVVADYNLRRVVIPEPAAGVLLVASGCIMRRRCRTMAA